MDAPDERLGAVATMRLKPGVEWRKVEGEQEVVALDLTTGSYFAVTGSGVALWRLVVAGTTDEQLAAELVLRFAIAPDRAAADVAAFLAQLRARGLVEEDHEPQAPAH